MASISHPKDVHWPCPPPSPVSSAVVMVLGAWHLCCCQSESIHRPHVQCCLNTAITTSAIRLSAPSYNIATLKMREWKLTFETRLQIPSESLFKGSEDQVLRRFTRSFTVWWWLLKLLCSRQVSPRLGCGRWCWWWPVSNIKVHANYSSKQWNSGRGSQP